MLFFTCVLSLFHFILLFSLQCFILLMTYLQEKVYKGLHKRDKKVLKYVKSAIFFDFKLNEKNNVLLKKMVWKKIFAGGRGGVIFNCGLELFQKKEA